jgi:hypothetical protein
MQAPQNDWNENGKRGGGTLENAAKVVAAGVPL